MDYKKFKTPQQKRVKILEILKVIELMRSVSHTAEIKKLTLYLLLVLKVQNFHKSFISKQIFSSKNPTRARKATIDKPISPHCAIRTTIVLFVN